MPELKRDLNLFDMTMLAIGATIGSGIFLTPSIIAKALPSPMWILVMWVVGGLMAMAGALTFAELGAMMPRAGGLYVFLTEAYGGLTGFLFGWAYFLVVNTGSIAALTIAFSSYLGFFLPLSSNELTLIGIAALVLVTIINVVGVKAGGVFSDIFTVLKLSGLVGVIIIGLTMGSSATTDFTIPYQNSAHSFVSALTLALVGVLWSYGGWQHATFAAAEAKDPLRTVPRSLILGALVIVLTYVSANVAYMFLLTPAQMAVSSRIAADAVSVVLGAIGGSLISGTIIVSTFGTTGTYTLSGPRIFYAMAKDGAFFRKVAEVHPKFRTPAHAIIFQSIWAIVLIMFWGTFENLISYVVFTDWIFFGLTGASIFIFRRKLPHADRPYKALWYPITPLFFVAVSAWFVLNTLIEKPAEAWTGIGFLALGVPVYFYWKRKNKKSQGTEEVSPTISE